MPSRTAKFVSAIFASVLAGIPLATISHGATPAADDCLSGPKDQAPQGSHWYYRIEHATKRHCWYLKERKAFAKRCCELRVHQRSRLRRCRRSRDAAFDRGRSRRTARAGDHRSSRNAATGSAPAIAADATIATPAAETPRSVVASRWPDQSGADLLDRSGADRGQFGRRRATRFGRDAIGRPLPRSPSPQRTYRLKNSPARFRRCCSSFVGALALAGLIGSAVFRFGNLRWTGRRTIPDRSAGDLGIEPISIAVDRRLTST